MQTIEQDKKEPRTKKLWGKLKNLLLKKDEFVLNQQMYLNILPQIQHEKGIIEYDLGKHNLSVLIQKQRETISLEEMKKFNEAKVDSTGVSLWPAEELLAYYCIKNIDKFQKFKRIAEYGAGYSGLAGMALAKSLIYNNNNKNTDGLYIEISDGNQECANLLDQNIKLNSNHNEDSQFIKCVHSKQYIWDENGTELPDQDKFDCIIIADCLFFRNFHHALIKTIQNNLCPINGECIIIAPKRGGTLNEFLQKCEGQISAELFQFEDETYQNITKTIQSNPSYNQDMHEFSFIMIKNNLKQ